MANRVLKFLFFAFSGLMLSGCGIAEKNLNSLADESAQKFNSQVAKASTAEDAIQCVEYYKTMENDMIKLKLDGFDSPIAIFHKNTTESLSKLKSKFKTSPEYGKLENLIRDIAN